MDKQISIRFKKVRDNITGKLMFVGQVQNEGFDDELVHCRYFHPPSGKFEWDWLFRKEVYVVDDKDMDGPNKIGL